MTDYFLLLGQPRQPWLDQETLHQRFLERSATLHPDRVSQGSEAEKRRATQAFAELNAAYQCLRDPKARLVHLLELETGHKPRDVQEIPHDTTDLFMEVGQLCRGVDQFLKDQPAPPSAILKAQRFQQAQSWIDRLQSLQGKLAAWGERLLRAVRDLNSSWLEMKSAGATLPHDAPPVRQAEQLYRLLSYQDRWNAQVQERLLQLTL